MLDLLWWVIALVILGRAAWWFFSARLRAQAAPIPTATDDILRYAGYLRSFTYYTQLTPRGKVRFMNRLVEFMIDKNWEAREGLELTEEMRVLISASAIQLTFGIEHYVFAHFHTIRVYPKAYYYKLTDQYFKGGASESGMISLSWKHFVEGYHDPVDRLNLGLHEWAHALKIDLSSEDDFDSRFIAYLENWEAISYPEFRKMHQGEPSFLRAYAGTNMHEFFAVCVEHFFEVPAEFRQYLPGIYAHLCLLLNQDPTNAADDYKLRGVEMHPKHARQKIVHAEAVNAARYNTLDVQKIKVVRQGYRQWPMYIVAAGLFGGIAITWTVKQHTLITTPLVLLYIVAFGLAGLLQWPYFRRRGMLEFRHFIMYSFCGTGLCVTALIMLLNFIVPVTSEYERLRDIERIDFRSGRALVKLAEEEGTLFAAPQLTMAEDLEAHNAKKVRLTLQRGMFGLEVVRRAEFVK